MATKTGMRYVNPAMNDSASLSEVSTVGTDEMYARNRQYADNTHDRDDLAFDYEDETDGPLGRSRDRRSVSSESTLVSEPGAHDDGQQYVDTDLDGDQRAPSVSGRQSALRSGRQTPKVYAAGPERVMRNLATPNLVSSYENLYDAVGWDAQEDFVAQSDGHPSPQRRIGGGILKPSGYRDDNRAPEYERARQNAPHAPNTRPDQFYEAPSTASTRPSQLTSQLTPGSKRPADETLIQPAHAQSGKKQPDSKGKLPPTTNLAQREPVAQQEAVANELAKWVGRGQTPLDRELARNSEDPAATRNAPSQNSGPPGTNPAAAAAAAQQPLVANSRGQQQQNAPKPLDDPSSASASESASASPSRSIGSLPRSYEVRNSQRHFVVKDAEPSLFSPNREPEQKDPVSQWDILNEQSSSPSTAKRREQVPNSTGLGESPSRVQKDRKPDGRAAPDDSPHSELDDELSQYGSQKPNLPASALARPASSSRGEQPSEAANRPDQHALNPFKRQPNQRQPADQPAGQEQLIEPTSQSSKTPDVAKKLPSAPQREPAPQQEALSDELAKWVGHGRTPIDRNLAPREDEPLTNVTKTDTNAPPPSESSLARSLAADPRRLADPSRPNGAKTNTPNQPRDASPSSTNPNDPRDPSRKDPLSLADVLRANKANAPQNRPQNASPHSSEHSDPRNDPRRLADPSRTDNTSTPQNRPRDASPKSTDPSRNDPHRLADPSHANSANAPQNRPRNAASPSLGNRHDQRNLAPSTSTQRAPDRWTPNGRDQLAAPGDERGRDRSAASSRSPSPSRARSANAAHPGRHSPAPSDRLRDEFDLVYERDLPPSSAEASPNHHPTTVPLNADRLPPRVGKAPINNVTFGRSSFRSPSNDSPAPANGPGPGQTPVVSRFSRDAPTQPLTVLTDRNENVPPGGYSLVRSGSNRSLLSRSSLSIPTQVQSLTQPQQHQHQAFARSPSKSTYILDDEPTENRRTGPDQRGSNPAAAGPIRPSHELLAKSGVLPQQSANYSQPSGALLRRSASARRSPSPSIVSPTERPQQNAAQPTGPGPQANRRPPTTAPPINPFVPQPADALHALPNSERTETFVIRESRRPQMRPGASQQRQNAPRQNYEHLSPAQAPSPSQNQNAVAPKAPQPQPTQLDRSPLPLAPAQSAPTQNATPQSNPPNQASIAAPHTVDPSNAAPQRAAQQPRAPPPPDQDAGKPKRSERSETFVKKAPIAHRLPSSALLPQQPKLQAPVVVLARSPSLRSLSRAPTTFSLAPETQGPNHAPNPASKPTDPPNKSNELPQDRRSSSPIVPNHANDERSAPVRAPEKLPVSQPAPQNPKPPQKQNETATERVEHFKSIANPHANRLAPASKPNTKDPSGSRAPARADFPDGARNAPVYNPLEAEPTVTATRLGPNLQALKNRYEQAADPTPFVDEPPVVKTKQKRVFAQKPTPNTANNKQDTVDGPTSKPVAITSISDFCATKKKWETDPVKQGDVADYDYQLDVDIPKPMATTNDVVATRRAKLEELLREGQHAGEPDKRRSARPYSATPDQFAKLKTEAQRRADESEPASGNLYEPKAFRSASLSPSESFKFMPFSGRNSLPRSGATNGDNDEILYDVVPSDRIQGPFYTEDLPIDDQPRKDLDPLGQLELMYAKMRLDDDALAERVTIPRELSSRVHAEQDALYDYAGSPTPASPTRSEFSLGASLSRSMSGNFAGFPKKQADDLARRRFGKPTDGQSNSHASLYPSSAITPSPVTTDYLRSRSPVGNSDRDRAKSPVGPRTPHVQVQVHVQPQTSYEPDAARDDLAYRSLRKDERERERLTPNSGTGGPRSPSDWSTPTRPSAVKRSSSQSNVALRSSTGVALNGFDVGSEA